jgi:glutamine amidotransferase
MCELFGVSSSSPAGIGQVLREFRLRGGATADNRDGWGIAWRVGEAFQIRKEPAPAADSELFGELCGALASDLVIAHVRKAKWPPVRSLANTHPFLQNCCGTQWVFAHNGLVPDVIGMESGSDDVICRPGGETDSEHAFCHLLQHIARTFHARVEPSDAAWFGTLAMVSEIVAAHGQFNFLMSNGDYLIAYGHDHLHHLEQHDGAERALVATVALVAERGWVPFRTGELRIYRSGRLVADLNTRPPAPPVMAERRPDAAASLAELHS